MNRGKGVEFSKEDQEKIKRDSEQIMKQMTTKERMQMIAKQERNGIGFKLFDLDSGPKWTPQMSLHMVRKHAQSERNYSNEPSHASITSKISSLTLRKTFSSCYLM